MPSAPRRTPETFGTGDVRGVIAPESSNNAKEGGHLVPTIAFGVPAGASMAILLGAFLMHGLTPGPEMLTKHLDLTYMIVWSLTLAHVIGAVICLRVQPLAGADLAHPAGNPAADHHRAGVRRRLRGRARLGRSLCAGVLRRHRLDHEAARLAAAADGARHRRRRASSSATCSSRPSFTAGAGCGGRRCWAILACVVWALYRPLSQIAVTPDRPNCARSAAAQPRFGAAPAFSLAVIVLIVAAIASSAGWPHDAKIVPLTACGMALVAAVLNLVNELFGREQAVDAHADADRAGAAARAAISASRPTCVRRRASLFFVWMALFIAARLR